MGFWKDLGKGITEYVMEDTYESKRHEVPLEVQYVTDRALVLERDGELTPKKMAKLADWDVGVLRWIGRERGAILPGMPKEAKAINDAAKAALKLAVEREIRPAKPKTNKKKPAPKMTRHAYSPTENNDVLWAELTKRISNELRRLEHHDFIIISPVDDGDRYVQFVRDGDVLVGECSGAAVDGGPASLSPNTQSQLLEMGWGAPATGPRDFPNFRIIFSPDWPSPKPGSTDEGVVVSGS